MKKVCNEKELKEYFWLVRKNFFVDLKLGVELSKSASNNSLVNFGKMIYCAEESGFGSKFKPV